MVGGEEVIFQEHGRVVLQDLHTVAQAAGVGIRVVADRQAVVPLHPAAVFEIIGDAVGAEAAPVLLHLVAVGHNLLVEGDGFFNDGGVGYRFPSIQADRHHLIHLGHIPGEAEDIVPAG